MEVSQARRGREGREGEGEEDQDWSLWKKGKGKEIFVKAGDGLKSAGKKIFYLCREKKSNTSNIDCSRNNKISSNM